ncbi:unnamed protein product [Caenorhabditis bovis]|uniref:FAD dependent oxidoreductase domain-containing protein n=1 Tax=Caenorhabditis bovis TaxID=2654633 RepID=A0A8S1EEZ7_9PELO|nr:unnamed protein product [Caenorhabditis bovis]
MSIAPKIAVIGEGVIGCTTAFQLTRAIPKASITVFHDRPFEKTCSYGPAGLFRIDFEENKEYGRATFAWFAQLCKKVSGAETGVKLISGHIQSDSKERLEQQQKAYGDIVYNFRFLTDRERLEMLPNPHKYAIHYTAYASEGGKYVPYLKRQLLEKGVSFKAEAVENLDNLADQGFDVIVNCAGLNGGQIAGDDNDIRPNRGIVIEVEAAWHKHFNYLDFITFTIPKENSVVIGSVKQSGRNDLEITDEDRNDILSRYYELHPTMKGAKILREWSALRPERSKIRIESVDKKSANGKPYTVVHHYGHGGNGFTLGWGTAMEATKLVQNALGKNKL